MDGAAPSRLYIYKIYRFPMRSSDTRSFYSLEEAFEALGRHLYASEWLGREITAQACEQPNTIEQKRADLIEQLNRFDGKIHAIDTSLSKTVSASETEQLKLQLVEVQSERQTTAMALGEIPEVTDRDRQRYEAWRRRENTENTLRDACSSGAVKVFSCFGPEMMEIEPELWRGARGFSYYLELSLVVLPRQLSSRRRGAAKVRIAAFDKWLTTIDRIVLEEGAELSPKELGTIWFRGLIERETGIPPKRDNVIEEMRAEAPGLSEAAALRIWSDHAPKRWTRSGPRR